VLSPAADIQKLTDDRIACHYIACISLSREYIPAASVNDKILVN